MSKLTSKIPGGGTALGIGAGLLAGGIMEHEWDKHEEHRRHHNFGGLGAMGGLGDAFGFGGPPVVENITVNDDTFVDNNYNNDTFIF